MRPLLPLTHRYSSVTMDLQGMPCLASDQWGTDLGSCLTQGKFQVVHHESTNRAVVQFDLHSTKSNGTCASPHKDNYYSKKQLVISYFLAGMCLKSGA